MTLLRLKTYLSMTIYLVIQIQKIDLVDQTKSETDANYILFEQEPVDTTPDIPPSPEPLLNFSDILQKNNKGKNKTAKKFSQK